MKYFSSKLCGFSQRPPLLASFYNAQAAKIFAGFVREIEQILNTPLNINKAWQRYETVVH